MADFCRTCTIELFGAELADKNDMIGSFGDDSMQLGLCEHCGPGWFDNKGNRIPEEETIGTQGQQERGPSFS
jgi:hypothetical protein